MGLLDRTHQRFHLGGIGDVDRVGRRRAIGGDDRIGHRSRRLAVDIGDDNMGAFACERLADGAADTRAPARHQRDLVLKPPHRSP